MQILHGRLRSLGHDDWTTWFDSRGYPLIRNMQLMVPFVLGMDLVVALDDDEMVEDPHFMRRAAEAFVRGDAGGNRVYRGGRPLSRRGRPAHARSGGRRERANEPVREEDVPHERHPRSALPLRRDRVVPSAFALGGNMSFGRELISRVGFDPSIARGEDIDYVLNAALAGIPYHFDKERPIRHLPPEGRSYKDFDYAKLQQDVRRFIYEREKLRAAAETGGLARVRPEDLDPYPGSVPARRSRGPGRRFADSCTGRSSSTPAFRSPTCSCKTHCTSRARPPRTTLPSHASGRGQWRRLPTIACCGTSSAAFYPDDRGRCQRRFGFRAASASSMRETGV